MSAVSIEAKITGEGVKIRQNSFEIPFNIKEYQTNFRLISSNFSAREAFSGSAYKLLTKTFPNLKICMSHNQT